MEAAGAVSTVDAAGVKQKLDGDFGGTEETVGEAKVLQTVDAIGVQRRCRRDCK